MSTVAETTNQALISGRAARAIVRDRKGFHLLESDNPTPKLVDGSHWAHMATLYHDCAELPAGRYPFAKVRRILDQQTTCDRALLLTLVTLDVRGSAAVRMQACRAVDQLISAKHVRESLQARFLSRVPPPDADFEGAAQLARTVDADNVRKFVSEIAAKGNLIAEVRAAWERTIRSRLPPTRWLDVTAQLELHDGFARAVAVAATQHDWTKKASTGVIDKIAAQLAKVVPEAVVVLDSWLKEFSSPKGRSADASEHGQLLEKETADDILVRIILRLPKALSRRTKRHCVKHGTPLAAFIAEAIGEKLDSVRRIRKVGERRR